MIEKPFNEQNLFATIFTALGIDPYAEYDAAEPARRSIAWRTNAARSARYWRENPSPPWY